LNGQNTHPSVRSDHAPTACGRSRRHSRSNPIEQAFAKTKHWMRDAQKRTVDDVWQHLGALIATIEPRECQNYIRNAGYGSN